MNPAIQAFWLTFSRLPGLASRAQIALLDRLSSIDAVFAADRSVLESALEDYASSSDREVRGTAAVDAILQGPETEIIGDDLAWLALEGNEIVVWSDPDYPPLLREISDPPLLLYVRGNRALLSRPQLAIVGSRNPTPVGIENAMAFARSLAQRGLAITSGLALGIDAAAHRGALEGGGTTLAVTGTGLDSVYPLRNRELADAIAARGAIISEFPIGTQPRAGNFPVRNRIISGLSLGVLVVEAALRSGSLITARLAAEQGREVFALPGSIHSSLARGCHALIRQGAKLVETAEHVLEELAPLAQVAMVSGETSSRSSGAQPLTPTESRLLRCLGFDPTHIDTVIERSGLTADTVSSILLQLELRGLVLAGPSGFQRAP